MDMTLNENLAATIRAIMRKKHMSLTEFAEKLGISRGSLYSYINARGNPSFATIEQIAHSLDVDPIALTVGMVDPDPDQRKIAMLLLDMIQSIAELPDEARLRMAALFLEMVKLWSKK